MQCQDLIERKQVRSANAHEQSQFFKSLTKLSLSTIPEPLISVPRYSVTATARKCHEDTKHESLLIFPLNTESILPGRRYRKTRVTPILGYPEFKLEAPKLKATSTAVKNESQYFHVDFQQPSAQSYAIISGRVLINTDF